MTESYQSWSFISWFFYETKIYISIGSDNDFLPVTHQAIIRTNADLLLIIQNKLQCDLNVNATIFIQENEV